MTQKNMTQKQNRTFAHVETWVFDLDNTLYPHHVNLWQQVDVRIRDFVHEIDHSPLEPNPTMGAAIEKLPGRKLILTNGSRAHAGAVLERLGIGSHFEDVFDIVAAELEPKPARQTYMKFLKLHGVDPAKAAMFEDLARNLVTPHDLGMTTVLVVPDGTKNVVREDWELEGRDAAYVDHITDDLTGFLAAIGAR